MTDNKTPDAISVKPPRARRNTAASRAAHSTPKAVRAAAAPPAAAAPTAPPALPPSHLTLATAAAAAPQRPVIPVIPPPVDPRAKERAERAAAIARTNAIVNGSAVLDEVESFVRRFWVAPDESSYVAFVLWAAHTHGMAAFTRTPRLALLGDEAGIGKTRGLDLLSLIAANAEIELDPTGPAFAVKISAGDVTSLLDETDTIWGKSGGSSGAMKTLRSVLNSGYRRGAKITRRSGRETFSIPVFGPVAFAGMGTLPDTLMSRSIVIRMRKRKSHEKIDSYMPKMHEPIGLALGKSLNEWAGTQLLAFANAWPEMPKGIEDRDSEICESLLIVADAAGGAWPRRARKALLDLLIGDKDRSGPTPAERVLRDLRAIWPVDLRKNELAARASTTELLIGLFGIETSPWASIWDVINASRELAALLAPKGISVTKVKVQTAEGPKPLQGYKIEDFGLAWAALDRADREKAEAEKAEQAAENDRKVPEVPEVPAGQITAR
jgi:hypothetical protein